MSRIALRGGTKMRTTGSLSLTTFVCVVGLTLSIPQSLAQKSGGQGSAGGQATAGTGGGQASDASGKGGQQGKSDAGSGSGQQYFVESDMLVYEASMRIAEQV